MPTLSLVIYYPVSGRRSAELSSRGQFSAHADFMNAWEPATLSELVDRYLNRGRASYRVITLSGAAREQVTCLKR